MQVIFLLEKTKRLTFLYDYYGNLLTDKQQQIMKLYFFQDFSLAEIAKKLDISRQGVYDHLQRAEKVLNEYEAKLELVKKYKEIKEELESFALDIDQIISDNNKKEKLQQRLDSLKQKI